MPSTIRRSRTARVLLASVTLLAIAAAPVGAQASPDSTRPFGTLRAQAERQQAWLKQRLDSLLPGLMRKYGIDMWVVPMREYNEDPVFNAIVSPTTFAARRRTIYVFFDRGRARGVERLALGGTSQGGLYDAVRSTKQVTAAVGGRQAELWGDQQWQVLKSVIETRKPKVIGIDISRTFAFADGLSAGEYEAMRQALGPRWTSRFRHTEGLPVDLIAARLPDEQRFYNDLARLTWTVIDSMFSSQVVRPGVSRTSDLVWYFRQRVNDLGLGTWFQPSVEVQRRGASEDQLGDDPIIQRGDVLHCDVGITALRLNTDIQHLAYVLPEGQSQAPAGLVNALARSNRLQDIMMEEVRPGRTGDEILAAARARMTAEGIDGTIYSHPIGLNGHGAGPLIGLWDYQEGVPGRGDHKVIANQWFSIELQTTSRVPEWDGQPVRMAQEEDMVMGPDGMPRWAYRRQTELRLIP
ncbi:MAG TPA: M24 family metallopeptidase [Gemmatimonadales bacterium]|nr:M24 family metallopeptidase [Gemmatimonadales bacterium]